MKTINKDVLLFIVSVLIGALVPMIIFGADFYLSAFQEVQLHDTYFIFRPFEFSIVTIGCTLFIVFLIRIIRTGFRNRIALVFLIIGTVVVGLSVRQVFEMANAS